MCGVRNTKKAAIAIATMIMAEASPRGVGMWSLISSSIALLLGARAQGFTQKSEQPPQSLSCPADLRYPTISPHDTANSTTQP